MKVANHTGVMAFLFLLSSASVPTAAKEPSKEATVQQGVKLIAKGKDESGKGNWQRAAKYYREANRLLGGESLAALIPLVEISFRLQEFDDAIAHARRVISVTESTQMNILARQYIGLALVRKATNELAAGATRGGLPPVPTPAFQQRLEAAVEEFRKALELGGGGGQAVRIHLAETLFFLNRWDEARSVLEEYFQQGGDRETGRELQCMLEDSEGMLWTVGSVPEGPGAASGDEMEGVPLPRKISGSHPRYPDSAIEMGLEARVLLWAKLNREGRVECVVPMNRAPFGFAEEAVRAVKTWIYEPAIRDGKPIPTLFAVVVSFYLEH